MWKLIQWRNENQKQINKLKLKIKQVGHIKKIPNYYKNTIKNY